METIYSYTRQQAIEDGVLADVSETAKEAGFKFPVAMTAAVFALVSDCSRQCQDLQGRLWDVMTMLRFYSKQSQGSIINFQVLLNGKDSTRPKTRFLKAICGPGDNAEPVITIMFPNED